MKNKKLASIIAVGLMAALCFVGNYLQIKITNGVLITRIHLGNSMCLLAGLLFGGLNGGLSSGIGAALFDVLDPTYIISAPITFISKFAMGYVCGKLAENAKIKHKNSVLTVSLSAVFGQLAYIIFYLLKTYLSLMILGNAHETALTATATNLVTSSVNAVMAVLVSVPLYYALQKPLASTCFKQLVRPTERKNGNLLLNISVVILFVAVAVGAIYFYALNK